MLLRKNGKSILQGARADLSDPGLVFETVPVGDSLGRSIQEERPWSWVCIAQLCGPSKNLLLPLLVHQREPSKKVATTREAAERKGRASLSSM